MKLLNRINQFKLERLLQLVAHPTYFILGILLFNGLQRPFYYYPFLMLLNFFIFIVFIWLTNKYYDKKEAIFSMTPIIMAGTIMLNMEGYGFYAYAAAGFIGILSRSLLRTNAGHIFNPGFFGVFALSMLAPKQASFSLGLWQSNEFFLAIILCLGHVVVYRARRLSVCYGYILGFSFIAIVASIAVKTLGFNYNGLEDIPVLFWPSTLTTATSLIFIFHVISDPKTSPTDSKNQFVYGCLIALVDFTLRISLIIPAEALSYILIQSIYGVSNIYLSKSKPENQPSFQLSG